MEEREIEVTGVRYIICSEKIKLNELVYDYVHDRIIPFDGLEVDGGSCSDHCWKVKSVFVPCHDCKGTGDMNHYITGMTGDESNFSFCNRCNGEGLEESDYEY